MLNRGYLLAVLALWVTSTWWLVSTKVVPPLISGTPPDYREILPRQARELAPVGWSIQWNGRQIGRAVNRVIRRADGTGQVRSTLEMQDLPIRELLGEMLGALGPLVQPLVVDDRAPPLDLRVDTSLWFDHYGGLDHFATAMDVGQLRNCLRIEGRVRGETLDLIARGDTGGDGSDTLLRKSVPLPRSGLLSDTFSPRPSLGRLRVGQTWTFQSYRPFVPSGWLELIAAQVEREELIDWHGRLIPTLLVVYRRDAGAGISAAREPIGRLWVQRDGTVIRQEVSLANLRVRFTRLPDERTLQPEARAP